MVFLHSWYRTGLKTKDEFSGLFILLIVSALLFSSSFWLPASMKRGTNGDRRTELSPPSPWNYFQNLISFENALPGVCA